MNLYTHDFDLSKETLVLVGRDLDATCDYVLDRARRLLRAMPANMELPGKRYRVKYTTLVPQPGERAREFSNSLQFSGHGPEIPRVDLDVAWGKDNCGREVVAWAEWPEKGKIPDLDVLFPPYSGAAFNACSPNHMPRSALAAVRCEGSWELLSPAYMISLRKGLLRYILDWETSDV